MTPEQNKEIKILFKKYKKLIKSHYETSNFEEPIAMIMRTDGEVTFKEKVKGREIVINHSDGTERTYILNKKLRFPYGKKTFTGYIIDENYPFSLPSNPIIDSESYQISKDKDMNDLKKWKTAEMREKTKQYMVIVYIIIAIIIGIILYVMLKPQQAIQIVTTGATTIKNSSGLIIQNITGGI